MDFGAIMIGLIGYGAGILMLVNAVVAARDVGVSYPDGKSADGKTYEENLDVMGRSVVFSFAAFAVTWLILKI